MKIKSDGLKKQTIGQGSDYWLTPSFYSLNYSTEIVTVTTFDNRVNKSQ